MVFNKEKKCFLQKLFIIVGLLFVPFFIILNDTDVSASSVSVSSAYVDFWSSSAGQQVQSTVSLPWDASIGGSSSDRQSFYLNNILMNYPISAPSGTTNIYGRLVMRFHPNFSSAEDAYFCDKKLNDITSTQNGLTALCSTTIIYNYSDNTSYQVNAPLYFNYSLPSGSLAAYVDYNQPIPNVGLSSISLIISKSGSYDVYSTPNGYSLVLTTLVSDASYYTNGSATDFSPIINQNNTIINQNQEYYNHEYEAEDNISNQSSGDIDNATNSQTTNIIGTIQNFATALGTVTTSPSGTCNITLPFPSFVGGDVTVNVCQRRGQIYQIITVGSSLLLIGFFVPFAYMILKMIYNEIRSFTNG